MFRKLLLMSALISSSLLSPLNAEEPIVVETSWALLHPNSKIPLSESEIVVDGATKPAISAAFPQGESSFNNALILPIESLIREGYNTIKFNVQFSEGAPQNLTVALYGEKWYAADSQGMPLQALRVNEESGHIMDNQAEIVWNLAPLIAAAEEGAIQSIILVYNTSKLAEGTEATLTISNASVSKE